MWIDQPPETDDLSQIMEYIRPKSNDDITARLLENKRRGSIVARDDNPLSEYGIGVDEFVELALQDPEFWDDEDIEYLHSVGAGEVSGNRIKELAHKYFTGDRKVEKVDQKRESPVIYRDWKEMPMGSLNVGEWWKE